MILQTKRDLEKLIDEINAGRPQCPVGLNTLVIPRKVNIGDQINQPYVYLNCGHVQGEALSSFQFLTQKSISYVKFQKFFMATSVINIHAT